PIAEKSTKGAWYRQWRSVSLDGSTLDVADTAENDKAFGRPGASRGSSAFPKIRFVALLENGTHVLWGAHMDRYATDELTLAEKVIPLLSQGMLCRADGSSPVTNSGGQPLRRARICCGARARMHVWMWKNACPTAPISAAFTPPRRTGGRSVTGWWSASSITA